MPRPAAGARLFYDKSRQQWQIRDTGRQHIRLDKERVRDRRAAEVELAKYVADRELTKPIVVEIDPDIASDPRLVTVDACLAHYGRTKIGTPNAELTGIHLVHLLSFWSGKTLAQVRGQSCRDYVAHRVSQSFTPKGAKTSRPVTPQTARRELETLSAAIGVWHREYTLTARPVVTKPEAGQPHPDWLTENEFEKVAAAAKAERLQRFLWIDFLTGSRSGVTLGLRWTPDPDGIDGHVDLGAMTIHRVGPRAPRTRKRAPPCRIPDRLLPMLLSWKADDEKKGKADGYVIRYGGGRVDRIDQVFSEVVKAAGIGKREIDGTARPKVTPHILRHSRVTLLLRAGVSIQDVASFVGMSAKMVETVYGHHHPEYQRKAAAA